MAQQFATMADAPMSPLSTSLSDELLAGLDELLSMVPTSATATDSLTQLALDTSFIDAFGLPEVPNPYDQPPAEELKLKVEKIEQTTSLVQAIANHPLEPQGLQQSGPRGKDGHMTPYSKAKPRRRKRPKDELDYLRTKMADLEEELTNLNRSTRRLLPISDDDKEVVARWKQVAERQKEEVNKSIVENLKLRAMLMGQLKMARRLEMAIADHQQSAIPQTLSWNPVKTGEFGIVSNNPRASSVSDELMFAELNRCLEVQYAQIDSLLQASGIADVNYESLGTIQLQQDAHGISFGYKEARLLPFTMHAVANVVGSSLLYESDTPGRVQARMLSKDHLNVTIIDTIQLPKSQCTQVFTRLAVRQYFEHNRVVMVGTGSVEIAGSVFVRLRGKGSVAISPFDFTGGKSPNASPDGSIIRSVVDLKPEAMEFNAGTTSKEHIREMTDLVLGAYHQTFGLLNQAMENLLLKDLMSSPT